MKKRIITVVLAIVLAALMAGAASAAKFTELSTTNDKYGFNMKITEEGLRIAGRVSKEDVFFLAVTTNENYVVNINPDVGFDTLVKLPEGEVNKLDLGMYLGTKINAPFTGVFYGGDIILEKLDGKWYFTVEDKVYRNNSEWRAGWVDPVKHLDRKQPNSVKMVTSTVIENAFGDYEKAQAIHRWIADNIYYDKDFALNNKTYTALTPVEVLTDRISVCEGYANLAVAMLNSAGIPAFTVKGYSLGVGEPTSWSQVSSSVKENHMWVEAYIDGKWLIMDPTWDSKNMYDKGRKDKNSTVAYRYFDISPEMLAAKHMIISRPNEYGKSGVSSWADAEVKAADSNGLITDEIKTSMKNKITREEFCNLVVRLLTVKFGKNTEEILEEKNLSLDYSFFKDTYEYNILVANALGIVNGKENNMFDPDGYITRQEAAVMLYRTAKVLGAVKPNADKFNFSDAAQFPSWSKDAIDFVSASITHEGKRVMGGVENNRFDPKGYYTKEQSVLTIYRLFMTY